MTGLSIRDAALAAGCPAKSASQAGSRLEKHPAVLAHLARLKQVESDQNPLAGRDVPPAGLEPDPFFEDPRDLLRHFMNNRTLDPKLRLQAAASLMPYEHQRQGESGKKEQREDEARDVAKGGLYSPAKPPAAQLSLVRP